MAPEYIFTRHGESIANQTRTITNRVPDNAFLTERGREQARELFQALYAHHRSDWRPIAIYASPLSRAKETAEILAAGMGLSVEIADALREPDCGIIEGRSDAEAWQMHAAQTLAWQAGQQDYHISGGESFNDIRERFMPFMEHLMVKYQADRGSVILVSHGSLLMNMLPLLLANIDADFVEAHPLFNCATVTVEAALSGLVCSAWCGEPVAKG